MSLEKLLQPRFIDGYTNGYCDGLAMSANAQILPEEQWNSKEKLDLKKMKEDRAAMSGMKSESDLQLEYEMIGYNYGYSHGSRQRDILRNEISTDYFDKHVELLSQTMKIQFLKVNRKGGNCYRKAAMDPDGENRFHTSFTYLFSIDGGKSKLDLIRQLLKEKKTQQAISKAVVYFDRRKNLSDYCSAITLEAKLMELRSAKIKKNITNEDYQIEKWQIEKALSELIGA